MERHNRPSITASPLILESNYLTKLSVSTNADENHTEDVWERSNISVQDLDSSLELAEQRENPLKRRARLKLSLTEHAKAAYNYDFEIELVGFFSISEKWPEQDRDFLVRVNAPALLFSSAREQLATITGRGVFPHLHLPSVTFFVQHAKVEGSKVRSKTAKDRVRKKKGSKK